MYDTAITFRTDSATKREAQRIFAELGMDISTALNIFLRKAVREEAIPFDVAISEEPNEETLAVIRESYEHPEQLEGPYIGKKAILEALHA